MVGNPGDNAFLRGGGAVAPDDAARLQAAVGLSVTGRAHTQEHHVLSFRVKGQESLRPPSGASGGQSGSGWGLASTVGAVSTPLLPQNHVRFENAR